MGFLDKLWDDIVAGPRPEKGLGRLRKQNSLKQGAVDAAEEEEGGSIDRRRSADFQYQQQDDGRIDRRRSADFQLQQQDRGRIDRRRSADFQFRQDEARRVTQSIAIAKPPALQPINSPDDPSSSLPSTPVAQSPLSASWSPSGREKDNIWRSVFHPGSNKAGMDRMGSSKFDKQSPNSPTVYDWVVISALDK